VPLIAAARVIFIRDCDLRAVGDDDRRTGAEPGRLLPYMSRTKPTAATPGSVNLPGGRFENMNRPSSVVVDCRGMTSPPTAQQKDRPLHRLCRLIVRDNSA
jgi:hypothetical protein